MEDDVRVTDTVRKLLEAALAETDDVEVHYKLRTALQLIDAHDAELERLDDVGEGELRARLRELGYVD